MFRKFCGLVLIGALLSNTLLAAAVTIDDGTAVPVRLTQGLKSGDSKAGEMVKYVVTKDVVINGTVAIAKGAEAMGKVTKSSGRGMLGRSGKLDFTIESVKDTGGSDVELRATQTTSGRSNAAVVAVTSLLLFWPALFVSGRDIEIKEGTEFVAYVSGNHTLQTAAPVAPGAVTTQPSAPAATFLINPADLDTVVSTIQQKAGENAETKALLDQGKIGVLNFRLIGIASPVVADGASESMVNGLLSNGYKVTDQAVMTQALNDLSIADPGQIDQKTAQNIAKMTGSTLLLQGSIMDMGATVSISYRLTDPATGNILLVGRVDDVKKISLAP